eukprot:PhM_4_TR2836/c0_g1_i2/m.88879
MASETVAKNLLQEICQKNSVVPIQHLVRYETKLVAGRFCSTCILAGVPTVGSPRSNRKDAEKSAAFKTVRRYEANSGEFDLTSENKINPTPTYSEILSNAEGYVFSMPPSVEEEATAKQDLLFIVKKWFPQDFDERIKYTVKEGTTFAVSATISGREFPVGELRVSKKQAEHSAAYVALKSIEAYMENTSQDRSTRGSVAPTTTQPFFTPSMLAARSGEAPETTTTRCITAADEERAGQSYNELYNVRSSDMPPGWQRDLVSTRDGGCVFVYCDHMTRKAYLTPPWEVWQRKHNEMILQSVMMPFQY